MSVWDRFRSSETIALREDLARAQQEVQAGLANEALFYDQIQELVDDELGWRRMGSNEEESFTPDKRNQTIKLARLMALANPLVRRRVRVMTAYVFGQGVEIGASDEEVNDIVRQFVEDHRNARVIFGVEARMARERDLETDGNLFLPLFAERTEGDLIVRTLDPCEIVDIVTNPEDVSEPWYYLRQFRMRDSQGSVTERKLAYLDLWRFRQLEDPTRRAGERVPAAGFQLIANGQTYDLAVDSDGIAIPLLHVRVGETGRMRFGHPEVYSMMAWASAYKTWLEDWASMSRSLARYAWRLTTKGRKSAAKAKLGSRLSTDASETNPAPATGSTFIQGQDTNMEPMKIAGANVKAEDGLQIRKMAAAGADLPDTILGADPDMGNLATAKTLDRPTELTMRLRQELWVGVYRTLCEQALIVSMEASRLRGTFVNRGGNIEFSLPQTGEDERLATIDVVFPPVLEQDTAALLDAIVKVSALEELPPRTIAEYLLTVMGIDDQDEILSALFPDENDPWGLQARDDARERMAALPAPAPPGQLPAGSPMMEPPTEAQAVRQLRDTLERLAKAR